MHLKRLEIQGFKTFAGRTILEFRPGVTAVVGPNGSGKSNLADAVRWVLGEQSLAALRCKRSEELIYAGGGRRAPAGLAEVSLTIDNSDRLLPLDFHEVTITRRTTRAGESDYFINRTRVRLRDLLEVTEPLGGSYTIINQGLVDAALTLRPEERRRLFEDAAEIGGFELRKAEAARHLRETEANLARVADLLAELEPRLRNLRRQATQARQQQELTDELRQLQQYAYALQWREIGVLVEQSRDKLRQLEHALAAARETQVALVAELAERRRALRSEREALGSLHQQASELHQYAEAAQRERAVSAERAAALTRRAEELERQGNELALRHAQLEAQRSEALAEVGRAELELAEQRHHLQQAEALRTEREQTYQSMLQALRRAQEQALRAAASVAEQQSRGEQLEQQLARLTREGAELDAALAQATQQLQAAEEQHTALQGQLAEVEAAQHTAIAAEQGGRRQLDALRAARSQAEEERSAAGRHLADVEARLESLSRLARSYAGSFAGVRAAMQWAERQGRTGFALVQSIIRTPAELEIAIEVALGSRLQNIVVDHWEDAEQAIVALKRSAAGRATFMPLDSLRGWDERRSPALSNNAAVVGVAADLVGYEARYEPVVRQLLGRVLVVRDLATARTELRTLPGAWMIVTLDGEQVQSSGSVTGGAQSKESGVLRRERELRELPEEATRARAVVEAAGQRRATYEAELQRWSVRLRELEQQLREGGRRLEAARTALDTAARRQAQLGQEQRWAEQRRTQRDRDVAALLAQRAQVAAAQQAALQASHEAEVALAEERTRQESELQSQQVAQEQLVSLRTAVAIAEGRLRAGRSLLTTHEQSLALLVRQVAAHGQARTSLQAEREILAVEHERSAALMAARLAELDALRGRIAPAEAALHAAEAALTALEGREQPATATLLATEAALGRAALEAQRATDRQESLFERAVADGIDLETLVVADGLEQTLPELQAAIESLKTRILRLGVINPLALQEYAEAAERQRFLTSQVEDLRKASSTLLELIDELDRAMQSRFITTFQAVAAEFERSFTRLFGGGSARLLLNTGEQHGGTQQGIEIVARPPGKKQQNINLLSGGERSLTAAALLFAILTVNPSPFCILDETDAALDETNVGRFRDALGQLARQTQCILITHNRGTIEGADTLYGVTMGDDGASRTVSLRVEAYVTPQSQ